MPTNAAVTYSDFVSGTSISSSQIDTNYADICSYLNSTGVGYYQAGTITATAIADGTITGAKLAASTQAAYRTAFRASEFASTLHADTTERAFYNVASSSGLITIAAGNAPHMAFYLDPADFAVGSLTTKVRLRYQFLTFSSAITGGGTATVSLKPISSIDGSGTPTLGAAVATAAIAPSTAYTTSHNEGAEATLTAGWYAITEKFSAAPNAVGTTRIVDVQVRCQ